jgi:hypothetical protein
MRKRLFKTMVALLAIAAAAAGPAWGQTTYNVTFSGFSMGYINTTVNVTSLPQTFTSVDDYDFKPWNVFSGEVFDFTGASVTSGGEGKVSVNMPSSNQMTITVTGTFEGTATIHVEGNDPEVGDVSRDITVACALPPTPHTVRMAEGTEDAANWSLASGNESVTGNQVLENVMSGSQVTATYNGSSKKVKSVKAVKFVAPAATVTTAPTATEAYIAANSTTALVNAGVASGGTMMYAVTTTNAQPASTADFSDAIPTAQGRTPGTYYVWYYAKADAEHSDSEIAGPVSVTLATIVTWNSTNVFNSAHMDDVLDEFYSDPLTYEGITISFSGSGPSTFDVCDDESQIGSLTCFGNYGDSYTFTAPSGKKFCKIEIIDNDGIAFDNYGDWTAGVNNNIVWSGTAANAVTLGTVLTDAGNLNSIVFTLIDD